jgi:hypothetical protein
MDNLLNSFKLSCAAFCFKKPVLVHRVLRKSSQGCPPCVFQEEKARRATDAARGTVKMAVLKGDGQSSHLVAASCYNQKPFYMILSRCKSVMWTPIMKKLWSTSLQRKVNFTFLRWSMSNDYNFQMNDNDIADQLRLVFWIMRFQRNKKWWWALFLRGYEVSLVNSYVSMTRYCELKGVPVPWTHHDWNKAIGYAHLDPIEYWPRRKGPLKNDDTTCPAKQDNPSDLKKKAPRVDSVALLPTWGRLKGRLNHNTKIHMPVPPSSQNATCQLRCWAYKEMHPLDKAEGSNIKPSGLRSHVM